MAKPSKSTQYENNLTYLHVYNYLRGIALNQFQWVGLEESGIPEEHIENLLYLFGRATVFMSENGLLCLQSSDGPERNVYGYPLHYIVNGVNYHDTVLAEDSVLIRNNKTMTSTEETVRFYTLKIFEAMRTADTNVKVHKMPFLFLTDADTQYTFKTLFDKVEKNEIAVFADKNMDIEKSVKCVETKAPYIIDKLTDYIHDLINQFCTELGINNSNTDKRERLIKDEVNANNELISQNLQVRLSEREKACERVNLMFGTSFSVKVRTQESEVIVNEPSE